jgi:hypothetical protein
MPSVRRKKKDFKLRVEIAEAFERLAPDGRQTAIVEELILNWVKEQRQRRVEDEMRSAYEREEAKGAVAIIREFPASSQNFPRTSQSDIHSRSES